MAKPGEINYVRLLSPAEIAHAKGKPFTDSQCGQYLTQIGAIFTLLPEPPGKLLDVGCGTGWTSVLFGKRGYDVVGVDICPEMIDVANQNKADAGLENVRFETHDYEAMGFENQFDIAVFFDALHHCEHEVAALKAVCKALRSGGVCILSEPGTGHADAEGSKHAVEKYGVNEKDMPPSTIWGHAQLAGFSRVAVRPNANVLNTLLYDRSYEPVAYSDSLQGYPESRFSMHLPGLFDFSNQGITILMKS